MEFHIHVHTHPDRETEARILAIATQVQDIHQFLSQDAAQLAQQLKARSDQTQAAVDAVRQATEPQSKGE